MTGTTTRFRAFRTAALATTMAAGVGGCTTMGYDGYGDYAYDSRDCDARYGSTWYDRSPSWGSDYDSYGYDCYVADDWRGGFANIGFYGGWYDDFYYPGSGLYLFDRYGSRFPMDYRARDYWGGRRAWWRHHGNRDRDRSRWNDGRGGNLRWTPGTPPPQGWTPRDRNGDGTIDRPRRDRDGSGWTGRGQRGGDGTWSGRPPRDRGGDAMSRPRDPSGWSGRGRGSTDAPTRATPPAPREYTPPPVQREVHQRPIRTPSMRNDGPSNERPE